MLDRKDVEPEAEREVQKAEEEPQGWCSPEFPSGCILDTDLE